MKDTFCIWSIPYNHISSVSVIISEIILLNWENSDCDGSEFEEANNYPKLFVVFISLRLETQRSIPTPFLTKTYQLVDDPSIDDLISWNEDGTTFIVWRPAEFARDLLPKYFKHNNFSSFVRFRKVVPDRWEFANDCFRRGEKALLRDIQRRKISSGTAGAVASGGAQPVTIALAPAVAIQISPTNSGDEQVLSSNSSPAATATPPPALRACASTPEILEENDRLRKENSQLSDELNRLRNLCSNIYNLMSSYSTNPCEAMLTEERSLELTPETQAMAEEEGGGKAAEYEEEMCPRLFGVTIGVKRLKRSEDGNGDDQTVVGGSNVKSEPLDRGSSNNHDIPRLDSL
ncbi:hypothetical protein DH2020_005465 [Rehmannia glutinosa]|uniref:HSF-type DNA-binding domain-containing protein n=1 Tax=Rehmannia glutinosa TaxID=99300 RepID=A0ABR0XG75_REHGL